MNQLQALWDEMAQNQIIKPKTLPVQNQEKKEEKTKKKRDRKPKANSQNNSNERSEQEMNQNIRYLYGNSTFFCKQCGDQSSDFNWFVKHVGEHRTEQLGIGEYPLKILKIEDGLAVNPWAGKDVSAFLKYCCPECEFNNSRSHLVGHIKTDHEKQLDFEFTTCSKKVGSKTQLSNHIFRCHFQVPCDICNKEIANPCDLKRHKLIVHKDTTGVWLCESCPKSAFFTKSMFVKHMKEKHKHLADIKVLDC